MAEAIWYYAQDDREHGPVTAAYIAGMAKSGKLRPDDLVWREGMEDWRPARVVKGLFAPKEQPAGPSSDTAVLESPLPPPSFEPAAPEEGPPSDSEALAPGAAPPEPPPPPVADAPASRRGFAKDEFDAGAPSSLAPESPVAQTVSGAVAPARAWFGSLRIATRAAMMGGLFLVLIARGCDDVNLRYVAWLESSVPAAAPENALTSEAVEAREAERSYAKWAFWRELAALFGAAVLAGGAGGAVLTGNRAERWAGVILLAAVALTFLQNSIALVDRMP
ncbi:MAG: DUF4339 domain-containing protein [Planctomycetes bacterium]|nr:DUF4339 domain-containing protein [Planctomycetota bacterium]